MRDGKDLCIGKWDRMNKKGQEEIVGFALIVILIAVVFLIFLAIFLRQDPHINRIESEEISQFLEASFEYTTDCSRTERSRKLSLAELIKECYEESECFTGESACSLVNRTYIEIINSSFPIGEEWPDKGYIFNITYHSKEDYKSIVSIVKGRCGGSQRGFDQPLEDIDVSMIICS